MAKHKDPASDNGRPANKEYDHTKTKDVRDTGSGRHSDQDKGDIAEDEDQDENDDK